MGMSHPRKVLLFRNMRSASGLGVRPELGLEVCFHVQSNGEDDLEQLTYVPVTGD